MFKQISLDAEMRCPPPIRFFHGGITPVHFFLLELWMLKPSPPSRDLSVSIKACDKDVLEGKRVKAVNEISKRFSSLCGTKFRPSSMESEPEL